MVLLNVATIHARTRVNGPGLRAAVWVQGCTLGCPGCFNPHTHPHARRTLHDPRTLADRLLADLEIEGLTLLGGEPFEQALAAAILAERFKADGRTVMTYSGYTHARLSRTGGDVGRLLAATDLLCAGPYVQRLKTDGAGWRGSSNQQLIALTPAYRGLAFDAPARIEVAVTADAARWTGQAHPADIRWLRSLGDQYSPATCAP